jgi:Zn-dependent peptidase ImmA (M78 family)
MSGCHAASCSRIEVEANKFASLFLMPAKLVAARFSEVFRITPFVLTEASVFRVSG